jgi:serine phosphatase RsbU (regulator of sigma subunit)
MLFSAAPAIGYIVFVLFAGIQGVKHVRVRTELELAEKLQQTLAPPLAARNPAYEILGRSVPSSQMGGDLLDVVDDCGAMACYVADVAGHGIQAGVFMGMVKSSARTALLRPRPLEELLADLNRVLFDVKGGSPTYVTFACLRCREGGKVEYTLAGNGPILHYHAHRRAVSQLGMEQFPLGLFANATFQSGLAAVEPGDILALLTDGLPEVTDANDEEFGLERIGEIMARNAGGSLADLTETIFAAVRSFGRQTDDETLVLVRATGVESPDI